MTQKWPKKDFFELKKAVYCHNFFIYGPILMKLVLNERSAHFLQGPIMLFWFSQKWRHNWRQNHQNRIFY